MKIARRNARSVTIGNVRIGGDFPVAIQSMVKVATHNVPEVVRQIKELEKTGCEIIRVAVKDGIDAKAISGIKKEIRIPLVADIHFDWRLAIAAIENGADKIRLNPGNIYKRDQIREVAAAAKLHRIPIRVGVNSGSVKSHKSQVAGHKTKSAQLVNSMVKSALDYIKILEHYGFYEIVVSLKASDMADTVEAYRKIAKACDYPLHLGVTATGLPLQGMIKSSIAVGTLLLEGIGDTLRISLTDTAQDEIKVAQCVLESVGLRNFGPQVISCPTCGRCEVDLIKIVKDLERKLNTTRPPQNLGGRPPMQCGGRYTLSAKPIKVAVMGCVVNGPGEAKEADVGVAFGKKDGLLFKKGKISRKVSFNNCVNALLQEIGVLYGKKN